MVSTTGTIGLTDSQRKAYDYCSTVSSDNVLNESGVTRNVLFR